MSVNFPHSLQTSIQFYAGFVWSLLNNCMNKYKNFMDDGLTADWLRDNGIAVQTFGTTHIRLLQAQQQAHALLTQHSNLLTNSQRTTLENFLQQMSHKNTRSRLKPQAAHPILNISSKLNRQLFKQHRSLTQA
jgi:hypothetical protein